MSLVSVITPTYGRPDKLPQLLDVFRTQTHEPKELLVYDDSPQPSAFMQAAAKADPAIRYLYSPTRLTIGAKRNALIQAARGDIIASFDDDDIYHADFLSRAVEWLRDYDFAKLSVFRMRRESDGSEWRWDTTRCGEDCYIVTGDGTTMGPLPADKDPAGCDSALWGYGFSFVFKRAVAIAEPFADMSLGEDYEFAQRVRKRFKCLQVADGEHLVEHTLHGRSSSVVFPQRRLSGSLPSMTPLPEGVPIQLKPGVRYVGIALLKRAHTAVDLKAKLAARGISIEELVDDPGAGDAPEGYRYVKFAGTASVAGELPWELPRPWSYVDKTRMVQVGAAGATEGEFAIVRAWAVGAGASFAAAAEPPYTRPMHQFTGYAAAIFGSKS